MQKLSLFIGEELMHKVMLFTLGRCSFSLSSAKLRINISLGSSHTMIDLSSDPEYQN
jgi:hypothetical protein